MSKSFELDLDGGYVEVFEVGRSVEDHQLFFFDSILTVIELLEFALLSLTLSFLLLFALFFSFLLRHIAAPYLPSIFPRPINLSPRT